jgi:hypothetical protein
MKIINTIIGGGMYTRNKLLSGITVVIFVVTYILIYTYAIAGDIQNYNGTVASAKPKECALFNQFMLKNRGKIVHISISLDAEQQDSIKSPEPFNKNEKRFIFSVPIMEAGRHVGGNEYIIYVPAMTKNYKFEYTKNTGQLSGYFMIYNMQSSAGGIMSVILRPIDNPQTAASSKSTVSAASKSVQPPSTATKPETSSCQGVSKYKGEDVKNKAALEVAITKQLKNSGGPEINSNAYKLKVTLLYVYAKDNWTILMVRLCENCDVYLHLFYSGNPLTNRYVATSGVGSDWGDDMQKIMDWVLRDVPGIPPKLASCYAWAITH